MPRPSASRMTIGSPSLYDGSTRMSVDASNASVADRSNQPVKRTRSSSFRPSTCALNPSTCPSPANAAVQRRRRIASRARAEIRSPTPLRGVRVPRKVMRQPPSVAGSGARAGSGTALNRIVTR